MSIIMISETSRFDGLTLTDRRLVMAMVVFVAVTLPMCLAYGWEDSTLV